MILFIHGFGSNGLGNKANILKNNFKDLLSPSLPYIPELAVQTLEDIIQYHLNKNEKVYLIGSSLGGFYSIYLSEKYNIPAVLINPAVNANITLKKYIGKAENYYDNSFIEWNENHINSLNNYVVDIKNFHNFLVLIEKGDEILNYKESLIKLNASTLDIEENGNHGYQNLEKKINLIKDFFERR